MNPKSIFAMALAKLTMNKLIPKYAPEIFERILGSLFSDFWLTSSMILLIKGFGNKKPPTRQANAMPIKIPAPIFNRKG